MNRLSNLLHTLLGALIFASIGIPITAQAADDDLVLLWGTSTEQENMFVQDQTRSMKLQPTPSLVCPRVEEFMLQTYDNLSEAASDKFKLALFGAGLKASDTLDDCSDRKFDDDGAANQSKISIIYSSCSMTMRNGAHIMRWTVPPLAAEAEMTILDMASNSGFTAKLETGLSTANAATGGLTKGNLRNYEINGPNASQQVTLEIDDQKRDFQAKSYDYSYMGDVAGGGDAGVMIFQAGRIESEGEAWIVADAPGADVVSLFYQNFADHVRPAAGLGSIIDGMIKQMAGLTRYGLPVQTKQTITAMGQSVQMAVNGSESNPVGSGLRSESESKIDRILILPGAGPETCGATVIPDGMEMTDMNEMMAGSEEASNAMADAMASPEMQEAMAQMAKEMENMSPEERKMMEQFGLGNLLGGAAAASNPAAAESAAAAAATQASSAGSAGGSNNGGATPSSADLTTDDLLESVQKHLEALGYDPGNTDGTSSVMTEIAISQFQAENGMTVTGKVTPQLLGILSAAVDK